MTTVRKWANIGRPHFHIHHEVGERTSDVLIEDFTADENYEAEGS